MNRSFSAGGSAIERTCSKVAHRCGEDAVRSLRRRAVAGERRGNALRLREPTRPPGCGRGGDQVPPMQTDGHPASNEGGASTQRI